MPTMSEVDVLCDICHRAEHGLIRI
jgi:hypothetical protein